MELRQKTFKERIKKTEGRRKETVDAFFNELDSDKDGKVSHDEFMVPMEGRFKGIDTNHDGFITREEFEISYKKHREKRMKMMRTQPGGKIPPQ
jgi:Ca2+-binding EF-hand superfamily protein